MKKIISALLLMSILLSLVCCNSKKDDGFNITETKRIVLGKSVDSVVITTAEGEELTFDNTADFYEIFDKVGLNYDKNGRKYSYNAQIKIGDRTKSFISENAYYYDDAVYYESRVKLEGDEAVASCDDYRWLKFIPEENKHYQSNFLRCIYKDEKTFAGFESNENGYKTYASQEFPMSPDPGSELSKAQACSTYPSMISNFTLFFTRVDGIVEGKKDLSDSTHREYKLYKNYIVFKQTAPILMRPSISSGGDDAIFYSRLDNYDYSITQEAYYNIKTGEFDLVKIYGVTLFHGGEFYGEKLEIDMSIYIYKDIESEAKEKVDDLINYVKSNSDQN